MFHYVLPLFTGACFKRNWTPREKSLNKMLYNKKDLSLNPVNYRQLPNSKLAPPHVPIQNVLFKGTMSRTAHAHHFRRNLKSSSRHFQHIAIRNPHLKEEKMLSSRTF